MIERTVVAGKIKEFQVEEYIRQNLRRVGHSHTTLQRTPLGEKVIVYASRPGLVVGRQGESIRQLTRDLKADFKLENPQVEVAEVDNVYLDANIVGELIGGSLERFGPQRFKATMHHSVENVLKAGAIGIEIILSGKLPSKRAKSWRVYRGHLKKSGDIDTLGVRRSISTAEMKSGTIGIKVRIMPPDLVMPDDVVFREQPVVQEVKPAVPETPEPAEEAPKKAAKRAKSAKRPAKKAKKEEAPEETPEDVPPVEEPKESPNEES
ncbi:30S ribosomal protein S3 [Candidatus Woesearchaeota archaeon]|nr:30S ribosomal protein S3 [Candidatus Woesearchaeota archaeon]